MSKFFKREEDGYVWLADNLPEWAVYYLLIDDLVGSNIVRLHCPIQLLIIFDQFGLLIFLTLLLYESSSISRINGR